MTHNIRPYTPKNCNVRLFRTCSHTAIGLGLSCTSPELGRAAYLAASAAAHIAMCGGPEAFRPFDGPLARCCSSTSGHQWEALHSEAGDLWKPELKEVNPERLGHIAKAQGVFARREAQARFDALYESYDANSVQGRSACTHLLSCACRPASALAPALGLLNSRSGKSTPASAIASASACCPPTPRPCNATAAPSFAPPRLTTDGARPLLHIPRCGITS
jgi:hypothetical protein